MDPWEELADYARQMRRSEGLQATLETAVLGAVDYIDPVEAACVAQVDRGGRVATPAASDDRSRRVNELQYELGEGPCLDAIANQEMVIVSDLASEVRWPTWGPQAAKELGVTSMLGLQLFVSDDSLGALTLYSGQFDAFSEVDDRIAAEAVAAHIAVAFFSAREGDQLHTAITGRTLIGQAQGMLMQRYDLDQAQAFAVLKRASQHTNRKLAQIAAEIVRHGVTADVLNAR